MTTNARVAFELTDDGQLRILEGNEGPNVSTSLAELLASLGIRRPLVVSGRHLASYAIKSLLDDAVAEYPVFGGFSANPAYEEVVAGVQAFRESECDSLISIGGGSAIDVAKCIKLFATMPGDGGTTRFVDMEAPGNDIAHIAVPTTAGTGSEATHFAVIYVNGEKHSVTHPDLSPDVAILDASTLESLPAYQKKATLLDALCQAIESFWSRRSNEESKAFSARAIPAIMENALSYLEGNSKAARSMMLASYYAGRAIDITTTTAPHAMSYKLTSQFGIPHGHAVALCMPHAWQALIERGDDETQERLRSISKLITGSCDSAASDGLDSFTALTTALDLPTPDFIGFDAHLLANSVNAQRLSNFPLELESSQIMGMYEEIRRQSPKL